MAFLFEKFYSSFKIVVLIIIDNFLCDNIDLDDDDNFV